MEDKNNISNENNLPAKVSPRRYISVLISLVFGLFLLWLVSRGQDIDQVLKEFRNANYMWILLAVAASLISHLVRALRWNLLVRSLGYPTTTAGTFNALMAGYLSNMAIPRLGEITRSVILGKMLRAPFNAIFGTVVAERVFDMFCLVILMMLTFAFQFDFLKGFFYRLFYAPLMQKGEEYMLMLIIVAVLGLIMMVTTFVFLRQRLSQPTHGGFYHSLRLQLSGLKSGLFAILQTRNKILFLVYSLVIWVFYFLTVYFCFFAIGATSHLTPAAGLTLLVVGSLGIVAPVPGGIGTYHFMTITTLGELYGIAAEPAISYAYISHATQTLVILITGGIAWTLVSFWLKKRRKESEASDI